jgi:integrase
MRGSIDKRGSGRWRARYYAADGRQRSRTFDRKLDAERWLATQGADVVRGEWTDPTLGRMTFAEWVEVWRTTTAALRPTTIALNEGVLRNYLLPRFGGRPLGRISASDVRAMVAEDVAGATLSNSAVRRHVLVLSAILGAAVLDGRIGRNPCAGVPMPPESRREMRFLEADDVALLADAIRPTHYRPLILTAAYVGLRWGELAGLRLDRVDLLRRRIRVDQQLVEIGGRVEFGPPKTRAGVRTVSLPRALVDVLGEHFATPAIQASGMAFPTPSGGLMRRSNFRRVFRRACAEAEFDGGPLDGLVFHELRHTAAALAIAQGAHPLAIRERLGHSSITVTMDTYGGLFPRIDEEIAEGLDAVLRDSLEAPKYVAQPPAEGRQSSVDLLRGPRRSPEPVDLFR